MGIKNNSRFNTFPQLLKKEIIDTVSNNLKDLNMTEKEFINKNEELFNKNVLVDLHQLHQEELKQIVRRAYEKPGQFFRRNIIDLSKKDQDDEVKEMKSWWNWSGKNGGVNFKSK